MELKLAESKFRADIVIPGGQGGTELRRPLWPGLARWFIDHPGEGVDDENNGLEDAVSRGDKGLGNA